MPAVNIEGVGKVNFPDDYTPERIKFAIENDILPRVSQPEVAAAPSEKPSLLDRAGRTAGLGVRAAVKGVTAIPALMADVAAYPLNKLTGGRYFNNQSGTIDSLLNSAGLPQPANAMERVTGDVVGGMAGQGAMIGAGKYMANAASPVVSKIGDLLSSGPGSQIVAAGAGTGSASLTREAGGGPTAQLGAAILGGASAAELANLTGASLKTIRNLLKNIYEPWTKAGSEQVMGRTANNAAGNRKGEVIENLLKNEQFVPGSMPTAGEAAVPAGSAEFSALQQRVSKLKPSEYNAIDKAQQGARQAAVKTIAGTPEELAAAEATRAANAKENYGRVAQDRINPKSDVAIMEEAIAGREASKGEALRDWGRFATTAKQQEQLANNQYPVEGMPRVPARYTNQAERVPEANSAATDSMNVALMRQKQADYLKNALESLKNTVGMDAKGMSAFMGKPSMQAAVEDALKSAQETGVYFPAAPGEKFSVQNLQRIKESLDAGIKAASNAAKAGRRPELSESELMGTREAFVKWLSNKSPGWRDARLQYVADSAPINQMQVGQVLEGKLANAMETGERAGVFSGAVKDAEKTVKTATKQNFYELPPEHQQTAENIVKDLARKDEFGRLAAKGQSAVGRQIGDELGKTEVPNLLNRTVMVAHAILSRLEGSAGIKTLDEMATRMQNPQEMARLMLNAKPIERGVLMDYVKQSRNPELIGAMQELFGSNSSRNKPSEKPAKSKTISTINGLLMPSPQMPNLTPQNAGARG